MIPPPVFISMVFPLYEGPDELIDVHVITGYTAKGAYGLCVMCGRGCYDWWDLSLTGVEPVTDRTGTLTDQVALHGSCIRDLRAHWASIDDPAAPVSADPDPADGGRIQQSPDLEPAPDVPAPRRRTGAYARRRVTT